MSLKGLDDERKQFIIDKVTHGKAHFGLLRMLLLTPKSTYWKAKIKEGLLWDQRIFLREPSKADKLKHCLCLMTRQPGIITHRNMRLF